MVRHFAIYKGRNECYDPDTITEKQNIIKNWYQLTAFCSIDIKPKIALNIDIMDTVS